MFCCISWSAWCRIIAIAHANCPDTYETTTTDHPSMLQCLGTIPGKGIDRESMKRTLEKVVDCRDYQSLWGWDFAVVAMCATSLGMKELAIDQLLCPAEKNIYVASGNNRQASRKDLPLYLPGNGSLLLATAQMAAGSDERRSASGFGEGWTVRCEGVHPYF